MDKMRRDGQSVREEKKRGPRAGHLQAGRGRKTREQEERPERSKRGPRPERPQREERSSRGERRERPLAERRERPLVERRDDVPAELPEDVLIGRNAVTEALKSGRGINKLLVANGDKEGSIREILALAHVKSIDNALQRVKRKLERYMDNRGDDVDISTVYRGLSSINRRLHGPAFLPGMVWFWIKVLIMVLVFQWIGWTFPRFRIDQMLSFGWKVLLPVALVNVLLTGIGVYIYNWL